MSSFKPALKAFLFFTLLTGVVYPLLITGVGKVLYPRQSAGSLVYKNSTLLGSELLGQDFQAAKYFHGRPQETTNLSPKSEKLLKTVAEREKNGDVAEMRYGSGSGLDPDISLESALSQAARVAHERAKPVEVIEALVRKSITPPDFGFLGELRINVLQLNMKLDE